MKAFILNFVLLPVGLFVVFNILVLAIMGRPDYEGISKKNISIAQEKYPGTEEDALIAYLLDTTNTFHDRTQVAVWTLGQLKSVKALPLLLQLYRDDPAGVTCKGRHDSVICQHVLYNAIHKIKSDRKKREG